jgi:hypothetical protein
MDWENLMVKKMGNSFVVWNNWGKFVGLEKLGEILF